MRFQRYVKGLAAICIILFSGCLQKLSAQEETRGSEHTIDSAMAISPVYMPVYKAKLPTISYNPLVYESVDTNIFHTPEYDPLWQNKNIYQTLGIDGQAHKNMVFDYQHDMGFSLINLPYELYFKKQKDLLFYDVETSYTKLAYTYGFLSENNFQATHAQRIRQCQFSLDLNGYSNKGYFLHQGANMVTLDAVFHYKTPKNSYGIIVSYILNHGKYAENGGLEDYRTL